MNNANGSGCHTNFSTKNMRIGTHNKQGIEYILEAIEKLKHNHDEHILQYGNNNKLRMTGKNETSDYYNFTSGQANRTCSVRIPNKVIIESKGYFEDRRPSSNMDPYLVTSLLFKTCCIHNE